MRRVLLRLLLDLEFRREWREDALSPTVARVGEGDREGVKQETIRRRPTVTGVADDGVAEGGEVGADLMAAAGDRFELEEGLLAAFLANPIVGARFVPLLAIDLDPPGV